MNHQTVDGSANPLLISTILFAVLTMVLGGVMTWALINYMDYKQNFDSKVAVAVDTAKQEQKEADEAAFIEREKQPYRPYVGPAELGSVSFDYPKTWSVYEANRGEGSELMTYLHPKVVPSIDNDGQIFALKVDVINQPYTEVLSEYAGLVEDGSMKAKPYKINGYQGTRFTGKIDDAHEGVVVIFKLRDKALLLTANSTTFVDDLDKIILKSLKFNP